jgi:hypothetical protein
MVLGPKTSTSIQTTFAAEAHLAEGQFLVIIIIVTVVLGATYYLNADFALVKFVGHNLNISHRRHGFNY